MYEQSLYKVITPIKANTISRLNKAKKWKYGYNKEHDVIIISRNGTIGEVYKIQNLKIALPKQPNKLAKRNNKWEVKEYPKELSRITSAFEWREYPNNFKDKWEPYIDEEFKSMIQVKKNNQLNQYSTLTSFRLKKI